MRRTLALASAALAGLLVSLAPPAAGAAQRLTLAPSAAGAAQRLSQAPRAHASGCVSGPVVFGLVEATSSCFEQTAPNQWQSSAAVTLDGVPLPPLPGTKIILTGPSSAAPGGELSAQTSLTVAGVTFSRGPLTWKLPAAAAGEEKQVVSLATPGGQKLFGLEISGSFAIKLGWEAGTNLRYAKFVGNVGLPNIFRNGPGQNAGGLTATVGLRVDAHGVHADAVKAQISNAYVGPLQIKELCLSYTAAGSTTTTPCAPPLYNAQPLLACNSPGNVSRWDGSADIVLPTADRPEIGVWAGLQNGEFSYAGGQATNLGNSVPLAEGLFLDKVGLALCLTPPPLKLKGAAGIHFGPTVAGKSAVTLEGGLTFINSNPWVLEAEGGISLYNRHVAGGLLRYTAGGLIDFSFDASFDFAGVASINGKVSGWLQAHTPVRFSVLGTGAVCVAKACVNGEVAASSVGAAGCFKLASVPYPVVVKDRDWAWYKPWKVHTEIRHKLIRGGAGIKWSGGAPSLMGDACDIGPYTLARTARIAADSVSVRVPVEPVLALQVRGVAGAPQVEAIAPDGRRYLSAPTGVIEAGRFAAGSDPASSSTSLLIAHPAPGSWRVRSVAGGPIAAVEEGHADEPPSVLVGVGRGGDRFERVLGYSYQPDPTHSIAFVERLGGVQRELGPARGTSCPGAATSGAARALCGELRFTPAPGPAGPRAIYAVVTDSQGAPSEELRVAGYEAPSEPEPLPTRQLTVRRVGATLEVSWTPSGAPDPSARPTAYDVDAKLGDGRKLLVVTGAGQHLATIPDVAPDTGATVTVSALRNDDSQGMGDTLTLAPGQEEESR